MSEPEYELWTTLLRFTLHRHSITEILREESGRDIISVKISVGKEEGYCLLENAAVLLIRNDR
jgi:hypothetical protein